MEMSIQEKVRDYPHSVKLRVRFNEVDMLGVCNNAVYVSYFEMARLEYIKAAGLMPDSGIFTDDRLYFMVRNEINYRAFSRYDDELTIYTKVTYIKNSSYGYEHIIVNETSNVIVVDGAGVVVHVDPKSMAPSNIPDIFIEAIKKYDKNVEILRK